MERSCLNACMTLQSSIGDSRKAPRARKWRLQLSCICQPVQLLELV
jgi:hypothetical protein